MGSLAGLAGAATGIKSPADQFVSMLRSRTIFDEVIERFKLRELYGTRYIEETRKELGNRISITAGVKDGVISVEVEDIDPKRAADMANTFVELLGNMVRQLPLTEAAQRRTYFEKKLAETRANLDAAQLSLRSSNVDRGVLKAEPRAAIEEVARLKAAVTTTEVRVASMRGFLTESNPDMRQAAQELAALRGQLAMAEKGNSTPDAAGSDYLSKYRDVKYHELLFELMARQYELAKLDETRDGPVVQVVDKAVPAEWKSKPKRALIAVITTIATGLALFAWLVVRELLGAAETQPNSERKVRRLKAAFGRRRV
jgi:capsule polysaccharide export protein KpsE/RkpR